MKPRRPRPQVHFAQQAEQLQRGYAPNKSPLAQLLWRRRMTPRARIWLLCWDITRLCLSPGSSLLAWDSNSSVLTSTGAHLASAVATAPACFQGMRPHAMTPIAAQAEFIEKTSGQSAGSPTRPPRYSPPGRCSGRPLATLPSSSRPETRKCAISNSLRLRRGNH